MEVSNETTILFAEEPGLPTISYHKAGEAEDRLYQSGTGRDRLSFILLHNLRQDYNRH